jgi:hypothetical protein
MPPVQEAMFKLFLLNGLLTQPVCDPLFNSPLKNGLARHRDVVPSFAGSERTKEIARLAEAPLANRQLKKPGRAFSTDC